jgi:hypothetical protein
VKIATARPALTSVASEDSELPTPEQYIGLFHMCVIQNMFSTNWENNLTGQEVFGGHKIIKSKRNKQILFDCSKKKIRFRVLRKTSVYDLLGNG